MVVDINMSSRQAELARALNLASTGQRISQEEEFEIREEWRNEEMDEIQIYEEEEKKDRQDELASAVNRPLAGLSNKE